ncbi:tyrosine-type recombinase/integrase (plasmid) [Paenibacillus thiaminolyticus]|uniref:tyrosine-type recombinase/integrase n=1 Tax=Paenibacillus thiaminolyticus TaxID=49283 RepID=UPI002330B2E7|nr:tyrosine-type recombinase/integrase [Paenibacillus thiaminolyticus]WCF11613.1 tyrosine-type recombinase/integrase [Paenibacillus thiaminolyticus]
MDIDIQIRSFLTTLSAINKSPHTIRNYRYDLDRFRDFVKEVNENSDLQVHSFKELCIEFINRVNIDENGDPYSKRSLNRKRSSLRSFIRYLVKTRVLSEDFSDEIALLHQPLPQITTLENSEIHRIMLIHNQRIQFGKSDEMKLMHHRNKLAFIALLDAGLKVSELVQLKWSCIRFNEMTMVVPKTRGIHFRIVGLPERLCSEFIAFKDRLIEMNLYDDQSQNDYIFFGAGKLPHHHLNPKTIERMIESVALEAGISGKEITSQTLRHTMAIEHLHEEDVTELTPVLGFSRNSVTKYMYQNNKEKPHSN